MADGIARTAVGPPAVVVGLDNLTGLQTARILAARGVQVVGIAADRRHWAARTKACAEVLESPLEGEELVACLRRLGRRLGEGGAVLVPCTDAAVATLSAHRASLPGLVLPLPPDPVVRLLMDKAGFAAHAAAVGLPVPRTEVLTDRRHAEALAGEVSYPCVLKPAVKSAQWLARTKDKAITVHDAQHLLAVHDRVGGWAPALLLQEWVPGGEDQLYSCNAYFGSDGAALATFVARKLRQWPPDVGTSASGEECRNDEVLETAVRLFGSLRYRGLAYLEMKRDSRSGRLMIIEPNVGRPTGRSAIAEAGGVELVHTAYCDAAGLPLPRGREQRYVGAKWLDVRHDLQAAAVAFRRGTLTPREWLRSVQGPKAHAVWAREDPVPFVMDLAQTAGSVPRRLARASRPRAAGGADARPRRGSTSSVPTPVIAISAEGEGS